MRPRIMLYHLILLNPGKDITLHVSANNPAMVSHLGLLSEGMLRPMNILVTLQPIWLQGRRVRGRIL